MHIHEYQAKELLRAYGIPTPQGRLARSHVEALEAARAMPGPVWVVKALMQPMIRAIIWHWMTMKKICFPIWHR